MDGDDTAFGPYLRRIREERGLDRKELAARAGVKYDTLAKWEQHESQPRPQNYATTVKLADALGLAQFSEERATLFWLAGEWIERAERLEGVPAARCRRLWGRTELIDEVEGFLQDPIRIKRS